MGRVFHLHLSAATVLAALVILTFPACKKNQPPPSSPAKGSLVTDGNNCYPYTVHGTYFEGVPAADTNFVEVRVRVTSPGTYNITTDQQKGVVFAATGVFSDTGLATVRLKASGTFTAHSYADFTTTFDSTHCHFEIRVLDSAALSIADNTWEFTAGGKVYHGPVFCVEEDLPAGVTYMRYYGSMQGFTDTSLTIVINYDIYDSANTCIRPTSKSVNSLNFYSTRQSADPVIHLAAFFNRVDAGALINFETCSDVIRFNGTVVDESDHVVELTNARMRCSDIRFGSR